MVRRRACLPGVDRKGGGEKLKETSFGTLQWTVCLAVICILQAFYGFGVIFGNGDLSVNVRTSNPELYYWLEGLMRF